MCVCVCVSLYIYMYMTIEKTIWAFVNKMMSLLFNMLSRFFMDFKSGAMVRNLPVSADERDVGWIPGMGRSPGGWNGHVSWPGKFRGQKGLSVYCTWDCKESGTTEHIHKTQVCHSFPSMEQMSFNSMAADIIHSDFGVQENKICHGFPFSSCFLCDGAGCHDLNFLNFEFQASFFTLLHPHHEAP